MDIQQLRAISNNFTQELHNAYDGKKTSLGFIVHQLPSFPIVEDCEVFQSIVIGGTVGRIATLKKNGKEIQILDKKVKQLSFRTGEEFLDFINRNLSENINVLALNFAYRLKPFFENGRLDGVLLGVGKEGNLDSLIGKQIGKEIESYMFKKRNKKIKVAVANDAVCLILSGLANHKCQNLVAGIVGTGINFALFIDQNHLVNLESSSFDKFIQSKEGKIVDQDSNRPKRSIFEKETAGAYLYKHFNLMLKENSIHYPALASTEDLNRISHASIPRILKIAQNLLKRSAQLVACQIAGITNFKKTDITFIMEGSLFWKGNNYKETIVKTVRQLVPEYKINFVEIENSAILGAAKLVS